MEAIVIITGDSDESRLNDILDALKLIGAGNINLYGAAANLAASKSINVIPPSALTLAEVLKGIQNDSTGRIGIIDSSINASAAEIAAAMMQLSKTRSGISFYSNVNNASLVDLSELGIDTLIDSIARNGINTAQVILTPGEIVKSLPEDGNISAEALSAYLAIAALASGEELHCISDEQRSGADSISRSILSPSETASLIRFSVNECNIEELFPSHAWKEHEEESLSYCYHTLAALFIKFGDLEAAIECLNVSEQFEDSPRLLALRGIIASNQGRALEAVANMVSSLQQYEARKKNDGGHYLSFAPSDIEAMNVDLKDGLEALNKRDNQRAIECFSKVIFNFDTFYRDLGVEALIGTH